MVFQCFQLHILYPMSSPACLETDPNNQWEDTESILNSFFSDFASSDVLPKLREHLRPSIINPSFIVFPAHLELKLNNCALSLFSNC